MQLSNRLGDCLLRETGGSKSGLPVAVFVNRHDLSLFDQKDVPLPHLDLGIAPLAAPSMNEPRHHEFSAVQILERLGAKVVQPVTTLLDKSSQALDAVEGFGVGVLSRAVPLDLR